MKKINSALISVYHKDNLEPIIQLLQKNNVQIYSTGGTQKFIEGLGVQVSAVEGLTSYPSIFGGRVKTLHPKVFGGILHRRELAEDQQEAQQYEIPTIDLVIVDLYPFEETVKSGASKAEIIEKIDIGGIALIRASAKNFQDVTIISSQEQYTFLEKLLEEKNGHTDLEDRQLLATQAFDISSHYDTKIFQYFNQDQKINSLKESIREAKTLRYGENPHQEGLFYGDLSEMLEQLHGKELSYNNLVDVDAAVALMEDFEEKTAFAVLKHTNACGMAIANSSKEAYLKALAADPISAFGGVIVTNAAVDLDAAEELNKLFLEVLIAPDYTEEALEVLKSKKNRILLKKKQNLPKGKQIKTLLNGVIAQDKDLKIEVETELKPATKMAPDAETVEALLFANKLVKHTKSNTIVLAKKNQLFASGTGQTSRVDALKQAIAKAKNFGFDLNGAVMASDAFFPFPDCVEIADKAGIKSVIQPGGSVKDQESIDYCDAHGMSMVFTGIRHFKH